MRGQLIRCLRRRAVLTGVETPVVCGSRDTGAVVRALTADGGDSSVDGYRDFFCATLEFLTLPRVGWLEPPPVRRPPAH